MLNKIYLSKLQYVLEMAVKHNNICKQTLFDIKKTYIICATLSEIDDCETDNKIQLILLTKY